MKVVCCGGLLCLDGRVLLGLRTIKRSSFPNVWDLPGGRHKEGETLEETLNRELWEELGIIPIQTEYIDRIDVSSQTDDLECHIFLINNWEGTPVNLAPLEHDCIQWFSVRDARLLTLACPEYPALFMKAVEMANQTSAIAIKI